VNQRRIAAIEQVAIGLPKPRVGRLARVVLLATIALVCSAHIGSPDAWYSGPAGPYQVVVHVKAPAVVPGIAVVSIKPESAVDTITAFVNKYDAVAGGPPPDVATPVANNPGWYRTELWVMDPGSNSVTVSLRGAKGAGTVVIPLVAVAARRLQFNGALSALLIAAALILVAGLLTLVGAAVRESVLPPGTIPDPTRQKRARFAIIRGAVVIVVVVTGFGAWWRAEDAMFAESLFKPLRVAARTEALGSDGTQLVFTITDSVWTQRNRARRSRPRGGSEFTNLLDDHGKLMHLFVIAEDGRSNFAHLHPTTTDSVSFTSVLPPLPAGRYRVFADVLHATGFTQTLAATISLDAPSAEGSASASASASATTSATKGTPVALTDADDAWVTGLLADTAAVATLADGATVQWLGAAAPHIAGEEAELRFVITPSAGDTARLEPYLGMLGHAAVVRDDGAVFIHLHPMGTVSLAAQTLLSRARASTHDMSMPPLRNGVAVDDSLHFPYAFPEPGNYTVWVQVKRLGRVQTSAFRVAVVPATSRTVPR